MPLFCLIHAQALAALAFSIEMKRDTPSAETSEKKRPKKGWDAWANLDDEDHELVDLLDQPTNPSVVYGLLFKLVFAALVCKACRTLRCLMML